MHMRLDARFDQYVPALYLFLAPALLLASTIAYTLGAGFNADATGGVIQVYAFAAFFPVTLGFARWAAIASPRLSVALTIVAALGAAGGVAYGMDSIHTAQTGVSLEEFGSFGPLALQVPGIMFPLSLLGIAITLVRLGAQPRWSGVLLALVAVLFPASRIPGIEGLGIVSDLLLILALYPLGRSSIGVGASRAGAVAHGA
jgi:hypothetical protein